MTILAENKHISTIIGRARPIFRRITDGPNPSEEEIKELISAPTSHLTNTAPLLNSKVAKLKNRKIHWMLEKLLEKQKNTELKESSQFFHISSFTGSLVFTL